MIEGAQGAGYIAAGEAGMRRIPKALLLVLVVLSTATGAVMAAPPEDPVERFRQTRDAVVAEYRRAGQLDPAPLVAREPSLEGLASSSEGFLHAAALLELATYRRLRGEFTSAIDLYGQAASTARRIG